MRKFKRKIRKHLRYRGKIYMIVLSVVGLGALVMWGANYVTEGDDEHVSTVEIMAGTSDQKYQQAIDVLGEGDTDAARTIMLRLARLGEPGAPPLGYGKAHLWVAKDMLPQLKSKILNDFPFPDNEYEPMRSASPETTALAQRHLKHAASLNPELGEAWTLLAALHLNAGERNKAVSTLLDAVSHESSPHPELHIALANVRAYKGDELALNEKILHEFSSLGQQLGLGGSQRFPARVRYLTCALILGKYENADIALQRLEAGASEQRAEDGEGIRNAAKWARAAYHYHRATTMVKNAGGGYIPVVDQLEQCVSAMPTCQSAIDALIRISKLDNSLKERVIDLIRKASSQADTTDKKLQARLLLQLNMVDKQSATISKELLERAVELDPENGEALLGLAEIELSDTDPDNEKILSLSNMADNHVSDDAKWRCHLAKGEAFFGLGQFQNAIVVLEKALRGQSGSRRIHELLAESYGKLGKVDIANSHRVITQ